MTKITNFHESLEKDFTRLTRDVEQKKAEGAEEFQPHDAVKESLKSIAEEAIAPETLSEGKEEEKTNSSKPAEKAVSSHSSLPTYAASSGVDEETKKRVEHLIAIAFQKDLRTALKEARKESPFIEDMFHDALVDKLLPELTRRGIL